MNKFLKATEKLSDRKKKLLKKNFNKKTCFCFPELLAEMN